MGENSKIKIVSNDLIRRLLNSSRELGASERCRVTDQYAQKLLNSGYRLEQSRKILVSGIKGYGSKVERCRKQGRRLYRTSKDSWGARIKKKLLGNANWYKKNKKNNDQDYPGSKNSNEKNKKNTKTWEQKSVEHKTVIFVEYTREGELGNRLRELYNRLSGMLGFNIKVVERAGSTLRSQFPVTTLWD